MVGFCGAAGKDESVDALNRGRVMSTSSILAGSTEERVVGLARSFGATSSERCTIKRALADCIDSGFAPAGESSASGGGSDCGPTEF